MSVMLCVYLVKAPIQPTIHSQSNNGEQYGWACWQVQQSPQVTAAHWDTFTTRVHLLHTHTHMYTRTHAHTQHTSSSALRWHALVMRLGSYLRHCSDKLCVCVCGHAGIHQRGKKNKWLMKAACGVQQNAAGGTRTRKTDTATHSQQLSDMDLSSVSTDQVLHNQEGKNY